MLKISSLSYKISSNKELVTKNLQIAYKNLGIDAMNKNNFNAAILYIQQCGDRELLLNAYHNAAIYHLNQKHFKDARYYASKKGDHELQKNIDLHEGHYFYEKDRLDDAIKIFRNLGNQEMISACLKKKYFNLYQKIKDIKTITEAKSHRSIYQQMLDLTRQMHDYDNEKWISDVLSKT
jgi:tetratricopeptide (TPR) repeat protein